MICSPHMKTTHPATARYGPNGIGVARSRPFIPSQIDPTIAPTSDDSRIVGNLPCSPIHAPSAARDRQRVVEGKRVSVRVDTGGRRIIKKKKKTILVNTK